MQQAEHIEVAPRMWDKSIAAPYISSKAVKEAEPEASPQTEKVATIAVAASGFIYKLKTYLLPIFFVLAIIIVIYVLWKYFTKYRKQRAEQKLAEQAMLTQAEPIAPSPTDTVIAGDTSKYECESESEDEDEGEDETPPAPPAPQPKRLTTIEEIDEDEEESKEEESDEKEEEETEEEGETEEEDVAMLEEPDIDKINEALDAKPIEDMDLELPTYEVDEQPKPKKTRRGAKRVVV